jgi:hypothetical protein
LNMPFRVVSEDGLRVMLACSRRWLRWMLPLVYVVCVQLSERFAVHG